MLSDSLSYSPSSTSTVSSNCNQRRNRAIRPLHIKVATTPAALECVLDHGIINWHGQQLAAVWTLHFRGAGDGSREAKFVVDEVVEDGH
jgi:hypothetical protein